MREPTKKETKLIIKKAVKKTGFKVIRSDKALNRLLHYAIFAAANRILKQMGFDAKKFIKERIVFVPTPNGKFYLLFPYAPGSGAAWQRTDSIATFAHELVHKKQVKKLGWVKWERLYTLNKEERCRLEGQAYAAGADVDWKFGNRTADSASGIFDAHFQRIYNVNAAQAEEGRKVFERRVAAHRKNKFATTAGAKIWSIVEEVMGNGR
jgi:hypothetical protein